MENSVAQGQGGQQVSLQGIYLDYNISEITASIKSQNEALACKSTEALVCDFWQFHGGDPAPVQVKLFYLGVLGALFKSCLAHGFVDEDALEALVSAGCNFSARPCPGELTQALLQVCHFLLLQYSVFARGKQHYLIGKITAYIDENYASEALTTKEVAEQFYLNPSYFCKIFKEETGLTFTGYLKKLRVEKAKELIRTSTVKIYDIAAAVGYSNMQYFSTVFKKQEGVSPTEYRIMVMAAQQAVQKNKAKSD